MCGRLNIDGKEVLSLLEDLFDLDCSVTTNRNAAPSEFVEVLIKEVDRAMELRRMKWWFTPAWFGSLKHRYTTFNARSEGVKESRLYKDAYRQKRCAVPVSGYFEWLKKGERKTPYLIRRGDDRPLFLAGIWDLWSGEDSVGKTIEQSSFAILTREADAQMSAIHHRQPLFINENQLGEWLFDTEMEVVDELMMSSRSLKLSAWPVSSRINNAQNKGAECNEVVGPVSELDLVG